jgi:hypothetical protein
VFCRFGLQAVRSLDKGTATYLVPDPDALKDIKGKDLLPDDASFPKVGEREAELLAKCMMSNVGGVLLKSHVESSAADCVPTVMPAMSPDRAKRIGTYWQTQQQLICAVPSMLQKQQQTICESLVDINSLANVDLQN